MTILKQYDVVRVVKLLHSNEKYNGWNFNKRPPQIGDVGTIVDILKAPGVADDYVVESSQSDGAIVWLGDFLAEEIELVESPSS